jgi:ABC-type uncharacterized transport system auxiliary subunit
MKKAQLSAIVLVCVLACTACGGVLTSDQPARQDYLLKPMSLAPAQPSDPPSLSLAVSAVPGLDSNRILVVDPEARLNSFAGAHWPDHLPEVLGSVLQRSLTSSGLFSSVETGARTVRADWIAELEIQEFYALQTTSGITSSVRALLAGHVLCDGNRQVLRLAASESVTDERLATVVAAHQDALDDVTHQLIEQLKTACP